MIRVDARYDDPTLHHEVRELKLAVGLENREGTQKNGKKPTATITA